MYDEKTDILKQILLSQNKHCSVCNTKLQKIIRYRKICIYNNNFSQYAIAKASLVECTNCFCLNFVKGISKIKSNYPSFKPFCFTYNAQNYYPNVVTKRKLTYQAHGDSFPNNSIPFNISEHKKLVDFLTQHKSTIYISDVFSINFKSNVIEKKHYSEPLSIPCPICKKALNNKEVLLYNEKNIFSKHFGKSCGEHFFIKELTPECEHLIKNNILNVNYNFYFDINKNYINSVNEPVAIYLHSPLIQKIIIAGSTNFTNQYFTIINYKDYLSRLLLSKAFYHKCSTITYEKHSYDNILVSNIDTISPFEIDIRKNGGITNIENCELIDILLYSTQTKTYEIARASYNKNNHSFYMDRTIYKNFVKKYGELEIIVYGSDKNIDSEFSMLKEESPLYSLGYSVNQKDNYSDAVRHEILIKIIDSQKLSKQEIISHLSNCINLRKNNKKYAAACQKWRNDIDFLVNYKTDVNKFAISK